MPQLVRLPDGSMFPINEGETEAQALAAAYEKYPDAWGTPAQGAGPKSGMRAAFGAGVEGLKGDIAALAGRSGIMDLAAAEKYRAEKQQKAKEIFKPTEDNWIESPLTKLGELAGGSAPYMVAPIAAGAAAAALPLTGTAATLAGLGAAGAASAGQFTATNLGRQIEEGKQLGQTDLGAAALAAVPQAALDMVGLRMLPGIRNMIFKATGKEVSKEAAEQIAKQGLKTVAKDYVTSTGKAMGAEGLTEAAQQTFERLQAGLSISDPAAQKEYFDSFVGGALLGGVLAPAGRMVERGQLQSQQAATARAEESKRVEAAAAEQQAAQEARLSDPKYLTDLLAKQDDFNAEITALNEAIKSGEKNDPVAQAKREQAKAERAALMQSEEYIAHREEYNAAKPQANALRIEQDKAKTDADAAAQAQAEADRQDPAKQTALHTQQAALVRQKTDLLAQSSQLARSGDTEQALALRAQATELDKQLAAMAPLMGKLPEVPRTYTSTPTQTEEAQIRARLAQLVGGTNARGKEMMGAYAQAKTDEDAAAILAESAPLQARLKEIESLRARTGQQADLLAEQENVPNEPGPSIAHAPLPGINTDALAAGVFGETENMIPGRPQTTGPKTRVAAPAPAPGTTALQQESMFSDMEPGGNVGTPLENLRSQIDQLKTRLNMPAATLAQLDNYRRVLGNPAMENTGNQMAQNALADIADNLNRIAYRGEGQGVERNMSTGEVRAKLAGVSERLNNIAQNIEQAKGEVRSASPESQLDRSNELRNLRRTQQELVAEQSRLLNVLGGAVSEASYPNRPTKYVQLPLTQTGEGETSSLLLPADAKKPAPRVEDATDEQVARAQRGDKRGYEIGAVNAIPGTITESGFQLRPGEDGEMETVATADTERAAPQAPTATGTARITRVNERTVGLERAGPEDADIDAAARYLDAELSLAPEDRRTIDLFDEVFGPASKINDLVQNAEQDVRNVSAAVAAVETDLEAARKELADYSAALQKALVEDPENKEILKQKRLAESRMVDLNRAAAERQRVADEYGKVAKFYEGELNAETAALQNVVNDALAAERKAFDRLIESTRMLDIAEKNARLMHVLTEHPDLEGLVKRATADLTRIAPDLATGTIARAQNMTDFDAAQELIKSTLPLVENTLGEKAADAYSNYMHARLALNLRDRVEMLRSARDRMSYAAHKHAISTAKKMADAKQALQARGETLSAAKIKHEVAVAETEALLRDYQNTAKELKRLQALPLVTGAEATKAMKAEIAASKKVESLQEQLATLTANFKDDLAAANKKLQNAEELRADVYANEQALRDKQTLPLADKMNGELKFLREDAPKQEADIQKAIDGLMQQVADANSMEGMSKQTLESLKALEESVYAQLRNYANGFVQVQENLQQAQTVADSMASEAGDLAYERVHASVATAVSNATRDQIKSRIASARFDFKQADANLVARIKETADILWKRETAPKRGHARALMNMRRKLQEQRSDMRAKHAAALKQMHRQMIGVANPEMEAVDSLRADIDAARDIRKDVVDQIENMRRQLEAIQAERKQIEVDIEQRAAARLSEVRAMMPSRREGTPLTPAKPVDLAPAITDADRVLAASLAAQRDAVDAADAAVNAAYAVAEDAVDGPFPEYFEARKALQEAVLARSKVEEKLREVERKQLDMAAKLPTEREALPTRMVTAPTPEVESSAEAIPATGKVLASGQMKGPVVEEIKQAQEDFEQRIAGVDNKGALAKELGGYKGQIAANEEALARLTKADPAESRMVQFVQEEVRQATAWLDKVFGFNNAELDGLVNEILRNPTKNKKLLALVARKAPYKPERTAAGAQLAAQMGLDKAVSPGPLVASESAARDLHAHLIDAAQEAVTDARTRLQNITKSVSAPTPVDTTLRMQRGMSPARNAMMQTQLKEKRFDLFTKLRNLEAERAKSNGLLPEAVESAIKKTEKEYAETERDYAALTRGIGKGDARVRQLLEQQVVLEEKVRAIEERMATMDSEKRSKNRAASDVERIAASQTKGRTGTLMKKETIAGDWNVGDAERNAAIATGTQNRATAKKIVASPTSQQVVKQAKEDLAQGPLQRNMERAKIERELDDARAERAVAKERADAVNASKASAATKAKVAEQLAAAEARVQAADKALTKEMSAASQFRSDRQTTEVDEDVIRAVQDGRVLDAAKLLAARGSTPDVRERAAKLIPMLMRTKISVEPEVMVDGKSVAGKFDPSTNAITMAPGGINEEDLMHEMTHAATDRTLLAPDSTLTDDQRAAKRELEALRMSLTASPKFANEDIDNTREFAAEVYSNEALRAKMDSIGKPLTLWQRFKNLVSRLLGWSTPDKPLSKKAEELVDRIMQPSRKIDTTAPAAPSAWRAAKTDTTSALGKMADAITAKPSSPLKRLGHNPALMLEMAVADMRAPLIKALSLAGEKALNQATYYVRKADALMNHVYASLSQGPLELVKTSKGNFEIKAGNGPSMRVLLEAVGNIKGVSSEDKMNKLQAYLAGQRAARVGWDKLNFDNAAELQQQAAAVKAELAADPEQKAALEKARSVYNDINKGTVNFLAASGYISKAKAAELLQFGDYVPFYRVRENGIAELVMGEAAVIRVGDIRTNKFLAPLVGDDNKLLPLNEAIVRNTMLLTDMALKNLAAKDVAYALQKIGAASPVSGRNAMRIHSGKAPAGDDVVTFRQEPDPADDEDTGERWMRIRTHGTALEHIPADMLVQSLEGSFSTLPAGLKAAAWFGDLLRSGVTRNPMYIARQLIRDPLAATFTGGLESGIVKSVFKTLGNYAEQTAGRSKEGDVLMRKGLTQSGIFTGDIDDINKMMLQITKGDEGALQKTLAWWDKAAMNADAATRIQMYKDAKARGLDEMEAELAAMEMMNFNKRGLSPTVQYAARMIPFLNAQIQGLNVLAKAMTGNMPQNEKLAIKEKFYRRAVTMALFTIGYAMAMEDDETYKNARPRDRYNNWILPNPTGGESIKLPIPFEVGLLFKALPEALVDVMRGDFNDEEFKAIRQAFTAQIPGASSYGLPQIIKPAIEVVTNHNFFTDREIESVADRGKDSAERFGSGTTELAKEMSKIINATGIELSPKQIDHLIGGYLGSVPIMVARLTNNVFASTESATRPTERASDSPIFGSLFQREFGGGPVDAAYAQEEALSQAKRTYDSMVSSGRKADAESYKEDVLNMLGSPEMAKRFKSQIDLLQKADKAARNTIKDPDALRTRLDELEKKKTEVSRLYLNAVRQIAQ